MLVPVEGQQDPLKLGTTVMAQRIGGRRPHGHHVREHEARQHGGADNGDGVEKLWGVITIHRYRAGIVERRQSRPATRALRAVVRDSG